MYACCERVVNVRLAFVGVSAPWKPIPGSVRRSNPRAPSYPLVAGERRRATSITRSYRPTTYIRFFTALISERARFAAHGARATGSEVSRTIAANTASRFAVEPRFTVLVLRVCLHVSAGKKENEIEKEESVRRAREDISEDSRPRRRSGRFPRMLIAGSLDQ